MVAAHGEKIGEVLPPSMNGEGSGEVPMSMHGESLTPDEADLARQATDILKRLSPDELKRVLSPFVQVAPDATDPEPPKRNTISESDAKKGIIDGATIGQVMDLGAVVLADETTPSVPQECLTEVEKRQRLIAGVFTELGCTIVAKPQAGNEISLHDAEALALSWTPRPSDMEQDDEFVRQQEEVWGMLIGMLEKVPASKFDIAVNALKVARTKIDKVSPPHDPTVGILGRITGSIGFYRPEGQKRPDVTYGIVVEVTHQQPYVPLDSDAWDRLDALRNNYIAARNVRNQHMRARARAVRGAADERSEQ